MPYIFGKLWHLAIIWAIRKAFQCILQSVRILLAKYTRISPTSENESYIKVHVYNHFARSSEKYCLTQSKILCMTNHGQYLLSTHMVTALCAILHTNQRLVRDWWRHRQNFSMNSLPSCHWILSALKYIVIHTIVVFIEIHCDPSRLGNTYSFFFVARDMTWLSRLKVWQSGQIW